jgi:MFS family permease
VETPYKRGLERNIVKYAWYKVVTKRLFLPLITIQLVNVGNVTLSELALIAIISSVVQMVLQLPGGYFADHFGNKRSFLLGAIISMPSPLFYMLMPNFWGGLLASILFFGGWAFQSGAIEAFIHDTMVALNREKEYTKIMGRSQSFGLIANVILIAIVPATYTIDKRLPFLIGFLSLVTMVWLAASMKNPKLAQKKQVHAGAKKNPIRALRSVVTTRNIFLFIFVGFLGGVGNQSTQFRELLFQGIGIATIWFGITLSMSSIVGAILGFSIHWFDRISSLKFYIIDLAVICGLLIIAGWSHNPIIVASAFILFAGYYRIRLIVIQSKLLKDIEHTYKATLLSALGIFTPIGDVIAISLLTNYTILHGYSAGYLAYGFTILAIGILLLIPLAYQMLNGTMKIKSNS